MLNLLLEYLLKLFCHKIQLAFRKPSRISKIGEWQDSTGDRIKDEHFLPESPLSTAQPNPNSLMCLHSVRCIFTLNNVTMLQTSMKRPETV